MQQSHNIDISPESLKSIDDWFIYLQSIRRYSPNTIAGYRNDLLDFLYFISTYHGQQIDKSLLADLSTSDFRGWMAARLRGDSSPWKKKPASHNANRRALSTIRSFFTYLSNEDLLYNSAIDQIELPKIPARLPKAASYKQIDIIKNAIEIADQEDWVNMRNIALIMLIYATGMRISEALSITPENLPDQSRKTSMIIIKGKGNKERSLPIISDIKKLIYQYVAICPYNILEERDKSIFRGVRGGVLSRNYFHKILRKICEEYGDQLPEHISAHSMRHSFATHMLENGADLRMIQELMGHASLSSTQIYTKIDKNRLLNAYNDTI